MSTPLQPFHYHAAEDAATPPDATARSARSFAVESAPDGADVPSPQFTSNEAAARFYLDELLQGDDRPAMRSIVEPDRPELVPGLVVAAERDVSRLGTHVVRFTQAHRDIPIFGASAVVELDDQRRLVSAVAELDEVSGVDPVETIGRADALERIRAYTGATIPADAAARGRRMFYKEPDTERWHLAWFFADIAAPPPVSGDAPDAADEAAAEGHGFGRRPVQTRYNYLIDAHDGEVLFTYSAAPTALAAPARCTGIDEDDVNHVFFGRLTGVQTAVVLDDPMRSVRTYDLQFADIDTDPPVPAMPVQAETSDYASTNRAAVSAHVNAGRVQDFYKVVLQRNGIDDLGMVLISLINTTAASMEPPPGLLNAFWWQGRMWYGQVKRGDRLVSLSRYLDVIAHELTHGVIETTSGLVYATQSGALNESFADCLGVIINNWYTAPDRTDVGTWTWEIGPGLRRDGRPLRDFADPGRLGHPAHMDQFRALEAGQKPGPGNDNGWVHFNSNIHNKAVHNLLTMTRDGRPEFTVEDVAVLVYLGMARLAPLATFSAALQSVVDVAMTYFGGSPDRDARVVAIRRAYDLVGIK